MPGQLKDGKSTECHFGHHARCRIEECKCSCMHLFASALAGAIQAFNRWAKQNGKRFVNLEKADDRILHQAAEDIRPKSVQIANLLDNEANHRAPKDPVLLAVREYNTQADKNKWKPGYINLAKADHRVVQRAARTCQQEMPDVSKILHQKAREMRKHAPAPTQAASQAL